MRGQQSRATIAKQTVVLACALIGVCFHTTDSYRPLADVELRPLNPNLNIGLAQIQIQIEQIRLSPNRSTNLMR